MRETNTDRGFSSLCTHYLVVNALEMMHLRPLGNLYMVLSLTARIPSTASSQLSRSEPQYCSMAASSSNMANRSFRACCTEDAGSSTTINIPDPVGSITSARLLFNPYDSGSCEEAVGRFLVGEAGKPRAALES